LDKIASYKAWLERKLNLEYFRVFGCLAYVQINDEKKRKLDAKYEPCMFIGYCEHSKAYKFFNPKSHKIIVSRDAIFDEGGEYNNKKLQQSVCEEENLEKREAKKEQPSHVVRNKIEE